MWLRQQPSRSTNLFKIKIMKKMMIAGGTGYLGNLIIEHFQNEYEIYILTRNAKSNDQKVQFLEWDGNTLGSWTASMENLDVLINLAGKNINTRFTEENKAAILHSRIQSTEILGKAVEECKNPPKIWLNASSIAVYEESWEVAKDENSAENGTDFLSLVSQQWEESFYKFGNNKTRKAVFRISLILGDREGSAYQTLKTLVKTGGGGTAGNGKQMVSWMGENDFVNALQFIIDQQLEGKFNFSNPNALSNKEFMKQLRQKLGMPLGLPAPEFLIRVGSSIIGTAPELVLRSQNVFPERLLKNGFEFKQLSVKDI